MVNQRGTAPWRQASTPCRKKQARRWDYLANDDVWNVRWKWTEFQPQLQVQIRTGAYRFSPLRRYRTTEGAREVWAAPDALVLKAVALVLGRHLDDHLLPHCARLAGHGARRVTE
jgi:hypothetical protein